MKRKRGIAVRLAAVFLTIVVLAAAAMLYERHKDRESNMEEAEDSTLWTSANTVYLDGETYGFDHRIESYLFVGTDNSGNEEAEGDDYHGAMADFLLLLVLDHTDDTYGCVQIDRNTVTEVYIPDAAGKVIDLRECQICVSHWYGSDSMMSAQNTESSVRFLLGELDNIDGVYVMNMDDIGMLNHAVGGVELTISEDLTEADPGFEKDRTLTLTDEQAERFVRARMSVGEGTNQERMTRQKEYMDALLDKVKKNAEKDPEFAAALWNDLREAAVTDMSGNDFSRIAQMFLRGEDKGIISIAGQTETGTILGDGEEHEEFYPDPVSIRDAMAELYSLIPLEE